MTYRENDVYFKMTGGYSLVNVSYTVTGHSVHSGQDPDGHIHDGLHVSGGGDGKLTFSVGRKGSGNVANWFNHCVPACQTTFDHTAGELNFAFLGTLQLTISGGVLGKRQETFTFHQVALAQGHSGSSNNWWFGGQNSSNIGKCKVTTRGKNVSGDDISFVFLRGGAIDSVSTIEATPSTLVNPTDWMSRLADDTTLDEIMMPGSHDAGMSELHHCAPPDILGIGGYSQTQSGSVGQQLAHGSRYFDIRVDYDYDELVTCHRTGQWGCNGQDLSAILEEAKQFLVAHSTETLILKFSHIRDYKDHNPSDTKQKIDQMLTGYRENVYTDSDANVNLARCKLKDLRGKIVLVFDYSEHIDPKNGRFRYQDADSAQINLGVYDKYSDTSDYDDMSKDQTAKWDEYAGLGSGFLFLLSWTLTPAPPGPSVETLTTKAHANLGNVLHEQIAEEKESKPNIVYLDYVDSEICQGVILYNFL